jgi:hypothetical protein
VSITVLAALLAIILLGTIFGVWYSLKGSSDVKAKKGQSTHGQFVEGASEEVEHIFNDEFREELRNRGRLHFEKIIGENAMFLQQDLRLTTSQLNEYMKNEITIKLQDEFEKYEESITDAKQLAVEAINKTQTAIEEQRKIMSQQIQQEIANERRRLTERFENNMGDIVNHYVLAAIGDQIDLNDQLEFILSDLEANKEAIIRDITGGA